VRLPGAGVSRRGAGAAAQHRLEAPAGEAHELGSLAAAARHWCMNQQVEQAATGMLRSAVSRQFVTAQPSGSTCCCTGHRTASGDWQGSGRLRDGLRDPRSDAERGVLFVIDGRKALDAAIRGVFGVNTLVPPVSSAQGT
jgi:hypothetical protein